MPVPPYDHHLNLAMQTVATVVLWGGTLALPATETIQRRPPMLQPWSSSQR